jgi:DNA (cytosine-5)-methyltransferase 1
MAAAGMGPAWSCLFANDHSPAKARSYAANWGDDHLACGDIQALTTDDLPGRADMAWASFPCQDISTAGRAAGIGSQDARKPTRSALFWTFWDLMLELQKEGRGPRTIVLENVQGLLTSSNGADFGALAAALHSAGMTFGAMLVDAREFVPQSRPRVFFVAVAKDQPIPDALVSDKADLRWANSSLLRAFGRLSPEIQESWVWWSLPAPRLQMTSLSELIEDAPADAPMHAAEETTRLLDMMNDGNRAKVAKAKRAATESGFPSIGTIYRRTRSEDGIKVQRAEVRFDGVAGCLRTPGGGSSRQILIRIDPDGRLGTRLMSSREMARLMGLPDAYVLPEGWTEAAHLLGDGVVVPAVRHIVRHIIEPVVGARGRAVAA